MKCSMNRREFLVSATALGIGMANGGRVFGSVSDGSQPSVKPLDEFLEFDALGLAELIKRKEISSPQLLEVVIRRVEALNPTINCIATQTFERARQKAKNNSLKTTFAGVPSFTKDMIDVAGVRRSDGSRLLATNIPQKSVEYVKAFEASGLNIVGTTTVPEFASGLESQLYGQTRNPWDLEYSCVASSSGAAAAVAAGYAPVVHGTDGGGSNRLPSHACGTFGFKPSRLRMLSGEADGAHDLFKTNNAISRTVRDSAALFDATEDKSGKKFKPIGFVSGPSRRRLRIAYAPNGVSGFQVEASIKKTQDDIAKLLLGLGHIVEEVVHPVNGLEFFEHFRHAFLPKFTPLLATVTAITGRTPIESGLLAPWTATMIESSRHFTEKQIADGHKYFDNAEKIYGGVFDKYDLLFTAVTPGETPLLGLIKPTDNWEEKGHLFESIMSMTAPTNAVGDCAISIPLSVSRATGMPVGTMFQAKAGNDQMLYELAYELEQARPWKDRWAPHSAMYAATAKDA